MSLVEMLSEVQALSRTDKLRLMQYLAHDLEQDPTDLIEAGKSYPIWSPYDAHAAAAVLLEALSEDSKT